MNEANLNVLNDIYHQNENNLQSYLKKVNEEQSHSEKESSQTNKLSQSKRSDLKYLLPRVIWSAECSKRKIRKNQLLSNKKSNKTEQGKNIEQS
jgi:hypothetical protein